MIFGTSGFTGYLTKLNSIGGESPCTKIQVRHSNEGEFQNFLDTIEKEYNADNIKCLFSHPIKWNKMAIEDLAYEVNVTVDSVEFKGFVRSISVKQKWKDGIEGYDYIILIEKEISEDNLDRVLVTEYLNRKEPDENEKMKLVPYQIKLIPSKKNIDEIDGIDPL